MEAGPKTRSKLKGWRLGCPPPEGCTSTSSALPSWSPVSNTSLSLQRERTRLLFVSQRHHHVMPGTHAPTEQGLCKACQLRKSSQQG